MKRLKLIAMLFVMALTASAQRGEDVTDLLNNPDFESGDTGWTRDAGNKKVAGTATKYGYHGTTFIEDWVATPGSLDDQTWSQRIEVPNGFYVVKSLAHAVQQSDETLVPSGVSIFANNDEVPVTTNYTNSPKEYAVGTEVTDGILTVGYRILMCNTNWAAWDYVRLIRYDAASVEEAKLAWVLDELDLLKDSVNVLVTSYIQNDIKDNLSASAEAIAGVTNYADANALLEQLQAQIAEANRSLDAYEKLIAAIDEAREEAEKDFSEGIDEFYDAIDEAQDLYDEAEISVAEIEEELKKLEEAINTFHMLNADGTIGFDVTKYITNPSVRENADGWSLTVTNNPGSQPSWQYGVMEFWQCDFVLSQTLTDIPNGMYVISVQGFYREGNINDGSNYGHENLTAELFGNNFSIPLVSIYQHTATEMGVTVGVNADYDYVTKREGLDIVFNTLNPATGRNYYDDNKLGVIVNDGTLTFGLRNESPEPGRWCPFRDFKLEYYGNFPGAVLLMMINQAKEWMDDNEIYLPVSAYNELSDCIMEKEDYTEPGAYEEEEVSKAIAEFDSVYTSIKNVLVLQSELKSLLADATELLALAYPGASLLTEACNQVSPLTEGGAEFELADGETTLLYYQKAIADFKMAIHTYQLSQNYSREVPADYTFLVPNAEFETKDYWGWNVVSEGNLTNEWWIGGCRPTEEGGANRQGVNLWSWGISSVNLYQELTDLPNGLYKVSGELITQTDLATDQHVYATGIATETSDYLEDEGWDTYNWTTLTTNDFAVVVDGKLTIGAASSKGGNGYEGWFQATNFKLYYYGESTEEDLKNAWESSLSRAETMAATLLNGDSKEVKDAIAAATVMATAGNYVEACQALNPTVTAWDSVFYAVQSFYDRSYTPLVILAGELDEETNAASEQVISFATSTAGQILGAEDATHAIIESLAAKLNAYLAYATYLVEAEQTLATIRGVKNEYKAFIKDSIIAPQVSDMIAQFRNVADCEDLLAKLTTAMEALLKTTNINLPEGDLTTDLVANPTIEDGNATGWIVERGTGNGPTNTGQHYDGTSSNRYFDSWNGTIGAINFTAYQVITALPDGIYKLTVAARGDGDNGWIFASPQPLQADTATWAANTQWEMIRAYGSEHGEIWYNDSLAWVAAEGEGSFPYFMARNGVGAGWSFHTLEFEVTNHYLMFGITANTALTGKDAYTGKWLGADDWQLTLVSRSTKQSDYNPFTGIENVETNTAVVPVRQGIYDLFGRHIETPTATGIYIVDGKKTLIKK